MKKLLVLAALLFVGLGYSQTYRISTVGESKQFVIEDVTNGVRERPYLNREVLADTTSQGNINIYRQLAVDYLKPIGFPKVAGRPYTAFVDGNNSDATFASSAAVLTWFADNTGFNSASGGSGAGSISDGSVTEAKLSSEVAVKLNTSPVNVKSYGAVGDGTTDDGQDIQDAIDAVYALGGGEVFVPLSTSFYKTTTTIEVKENVHLRFEKGAELRNFADVNTIQLRRGSTLSGAKLNLDSGVTFTKAHLYYYAGNNVSVGGRFQHHVRDVILLGNTVGEGDAIYMFADKITEGSSAGAIFAVTMERINIRGGFENAIHLRADEDTGVANENQSWINNNIFKDFIIDGVEKVIFAEENGNGAAAIQHNVFENFQVQCESDLTDLIIGSEFYEANRHINWGIQDFDYANKPAITFTHELGQERNHANIVQFVGMGDSLEDLVSQAYPLNTDIIDLTGEEPWSYSPVVSTGDFGITPNKNGRTYRTTGTGLITGSLPAAEVGLRYAIINQNGDDVYIDPNGTDAIGNKGAGVPYPIVGINSRLEIRCYVDGYWAVMSDTSIGPKVISLTSNRNITSTDIDNTIACTTSATLTITEDFNNMSIGQIINLEAHGVTLTITGASGVTVNGSSAGSVEIGDNSGYIGGILRKTGVNSYVVL